MSDERQEEFVLTGTELLLLALGTANFSATLGVLEILVRLGLVAEDDLKNLHERMSAAMDAVAPAAPMALATRTQTMIDLTFVRLRDLVRFPAS